MMDVRETFAATIYLLTFFFVVGIVVGVVQAIRKEK
jgi:hypothetical protein